MKGLSLEVRVGLLVLTAMVLLGAFIFVLGGFSFEEGYTIYVDFNNPGNIKPGAPVTVGGIKVGRVEEVTYRGGDLDPQTGWRSLVRVRLSVDESIKRTIHDDALVFVTAQSILAEQVIAIDPGNPERPALEDGAILRGVDPPRLDLALALGYELLDTLVEVLRNNREELTDLLANVAGLMRSLNQLLGDNRERIDRIIANVETATDEATQLIRSTRGTIEGAEVQRIVRNLDHSLASVSRDLDPILRDTRDAVHNANETLAALGPEERDEIRSTIRNASQLAERANRTVADAQAIVTNIRQGHGTVGALLMDEEIYDDLQEMIRDLKHNPWKFFWRE